MLFWFERIPRRLKRIPDSPHEIAKAFAVGVFIGILPGTGLLVALLAAQVFHLSKGAAVLGSLTTNPWTVAPFYVISYRLGKWILQLEAPIEWHVLREFNTGWTHELGKVFPALATGGVVVGLVAAFLSYGLVLYVVTRYRKARLKRLHVTP